MIKVRIPSPLRNYTNGVDVVEVDGATIGEVLNNLKTKAAGIETRLFKGPNQLNRFVNVYLNDEDIRFQKNLETPVKAGDEISIVPAIAGGRLKKMLYDLVRPLLFQLPAESAHALGSISLNTLLSTKTARSLARKRLATTDPALAIERFGIRFPNPVGLAAGFDKSGHLFNALGALGFGSIEIGTVTAHAQPGNPKPRLFRLPIDQALLNRMGFNNPGAEAVAEHLKTARIEPILGINIGKSKVTPLEEAPVDYLKSLELLEPYAHYIAINVSSPNTPNLRDLQDSTPLRELLSAVKSRAVQLAAASGRSPRPILLKIAPDLGDAQLEQIVNVATDEGVSGIIATNTTISRADLRTPAAELESLGAGGVSGAPLRARSLRMVSRIYENTRGDLPIIGVGGIQTAADAWAMIGAGASLIQLYTGFIYGGPTIVSRINAGLSALLREARLNSLEQAVGWAHRK